MNRVRKNAKKIMIMMEPRMKRLMEKIRDEQQIDYFSFTPEDRDKIAKQIAGSALQQTFDILNNYTREELPDLFVITINNLKSLEQQFIEMEMYQQCAMIKDANIILTNDLSNLD